MFAFKKIFAEAHKSLLHRFRYFHSTLFWLLFPTLNLIPFLIIGKYWAGNFNSRILYAVANTSDLWSFLVIGDILATFFGALYWRTCYEIWLELKYKTIWHFLYIKNSFTNLIIGKMIAISVVAFLYTIPIYINAVLIFQKPIAISKVLYAYLALLISTPAVIGINFLLTSYTLVSKDFTMTVTVVEELNYIFSPIRYPVEVFKITRLISFFLPLTYALYIARILGGFNFKVPATFYIQLLSLNTLILGGGILALRKAIKYIKKSGEIDF